ncbi:Nicotinate-nucleotide--dimethylbenzimidazole phosphoribosyltransferase [Leminorella grimontii]|nr:Nicotinate-nucleotide--dimethylbenzimidazole phosphoribosyltransferase [Leminorella grimontii]
MQTLNHIINAINTPSDACEKGMAERLNGLVKPIGSLGRLESLAIQLSGISHTLAPAYPRKQIIVTAADHGVYDEDVSSAPQVVTRMQMVNMVEEKAGVNVLAKQAGAEVLLVDTGIKGDTIDRVLDFRVRQGSDNIAMGPAMRRDEAYCLIERCANLAIAQVEKGVSLIGVGELGMANTTPAAAMVSVMCHAAPELTVGVGANFPRAAVAA